MCIGRRDEPDGNKCGAIWIETQYVFYNSSAGGGPVIDMIDVRRRHFITLLGGATTWPLAARAADEIPQPLSAPANATMNSEAWNFLYSPNMPAHPTARDATDWEFNFPPRDGVHYLVHPVIGRLGSQI